MSIWLEKPLVLAIHERQIAEHGGSSGVRDEALLESALVRPQQLAAYGNPEPDLADLAAALAYGLARNHPFVDGSKRTAAVCCETFVELNGAMIQADDAELYPQYVALAEGNLSERAFAAWLRERVQPASRGELHEPATPYRASARAPRRMGLRRASAR